MTKNRALIALLPLCLFILMGCQSASTEQLPTTAPEQPASLYEPEISAWVVYWDLENALAELQAKKERLTAISYFAAYFDKDENLFIPDALTEFRHTAEQELGGEISDSYLSIVNDLLLEKGSSLKDTELLTRLFASEEAMQAHIEQIMALAVDNGYTGIDIDYEAIRNNMQLWEDFLVFCQALYERTNEAGLKLRVLLEPNAPLEKLQNIPEGPEYVMMCYNLHGGGSNSGPKADAEFLQKLTAKMSSLPGKKTFALATGGYDWEQGDNGKQITEEGAVELLNSTGAELQRDEKSGALTFRYVDENGAKHIVWYADAETIDYWQSIILQAGDYDIMLWRLGGNVF